MKNYLRILSHPIFVNLGFHMPMVVDLSHPLIMLQGENGSGKSTLLSSLYYALKGEEVDGFVYQVHFEEEHPTEVFLFDAEQHNPRLQLEFFENQPKMKEMLQMASHGQVMLAMFRDSFPNLPDGTLLLLDEPEMALSPSNQQRVLKMLMELANQKELPNRGCHAFSDTHRIQRNLRYQPRPSRQQERHPHRYGSRGRQHTPLGKFLFVFYFITLNNLNIRYKLIKISCFHKKEPAMKPLYRSILYGPAQCRNG